MADPKGETSRPIAEISHGPSGFEQFLDKNQKLLIIVGIALAIGASIWVVLRGMKDGAEQAAGAALVSAEDISSLQDVISQNPDTQAAISASLLLADSQWDDGQKTEAIATLRGMVENHPNHPAAGPARARLGSRLVQQESYDDARSVFESLSADPQSAYLSPFSLIALGEIAKKQGKLDEAEVYFKQVAEQYPGSSMSQIVSQQLKLVGFEMPEEVDPPEESATEGETPQPGQPTSQPFQMIPGAGTGTGEPANGGGLSTDSPMIDILQGGDGGETESPTPEAPETEGDAAAPESDPEPADSSPAGEPRDLQPAGEPIESDSAGQSGE